MVMHLRSHWLISFCCAALFAIRGITSATAVPSLEMHIGGSSAVVNEPYSVVYDVWWSGDASEYASVPPQVDVEGWGTVENVTTSTHVEDGKNVIRHTITILPTEIGVFSVPETEVAYFSPADLLGVEDEEASTSAYPTLQAGILLVTVREPTDYLLNSVMFAGFGIILISCALFFRRRQAGLAARITEYSEISIPSIIHDARKHKLDRDFYSFFQGLLRAAGLLKDVEIRKELQKHYEELTLAAGYQGLVISDDDMDAAIEKLEAAHRSDRRSTSLNKHT